MTTHMERTGERLNARTEHTDAVIGVFVEGQAALPVHPGCAPVGVPIVGYLRASENEQGDERCARQGCGRDLA